MGAAELNCTAPADKKLPCRLAGERDGDVAGQSPAGAAEHLQQSRIKDCCVESPE